jgi:hypothetical protein
MRTSVLRIFNASFKIKSKSTPLMEKNEIKSSVFENSENRYNGTKTFSKHANSEQVPKSF